MLDSRVKQRHTPDSSGSCGKWTLIVPPSSPRMVPCMPGLIPSANCTLGRTSTSLPTRQGTSSKPGMSSLGNAITFLDEGSVVVRVPVLYGGLQVAQRLCDLADNGG